LNNHRDDRNYSKVDSSDKLTTLEKNE